jgi:hypothetical protein
VQGLELYYFKHTKVSTNLLFWLNIIARVRAMPGNDGHP